LMLFPSLLFSLATQGSGPEQESTIQASGSEAAVC
jgi:hypothetical protein